MKLSFTLIVSAIFLAYIGHSMWVIYGIFNPTPCANSQRCIYPFIGLKPEPQLQLQVFTSTKQKGVSENDLKLIWRNNSLDIHNSLEKEFNVSMPLKTRRNGTLYIHVFVHPKGDDPFNSTYSVHTHVPMTTYSLPQAEFFSLLGDRNENESLDRNTPISHWRKKLFVTLVTDPLAIDMHAIPADIYKFISLAPNGRYLPIVYIDHISFRVRDLLPINRSSITMPLSITYSPISIGKLRFWSNMMESMKMLHGFGFSEKDTDEVKGIFADTNFTFLMLTFAVAAFHLLFDFLAFKNDISYWKGRKSMVGLSSRAVLWRCVSTIIIFFYLMDQETSLLVLIPAGIGAFIEVWKVKKALKLTIHWRGLRPSYEIGKTSEQEKETAAFDSEAMKYLLYLLLPLCICGAVYSLFYTPHKSWYSWCIQSLVNGVYAFGFLFMLPQLFVNYKLKSVAHLPWRAFTYKAFNTFIDDIFAFIITMPTAHRLACFRDDVVFVVYLYQRWLYPVDKKRVNEFGRSYEDEDDKKKK
ncbi:cleft lip and palate transmembrane protein 1-like protein [Mizuhopecten yessoensis]|uniref:Lipid scramblase CLPTM1L n=1 Tax=Mizuhopecten yessoensis TaxID=6573 RepID=A0A210QNL8_MIZYE|nr:cleft lip and palate transmembrane protein 1-like protein [Mizuhopecten yessoensis]XP_021353766.1 cleft lip and palate transmembrane protein 1-like protein [Mizuhopecten yessoensis]XP_021353767.1 cleft lip and palate transmembrane protein 1-like protein [Mizuhopecten yessoensis]OWF50337.1 Cleft lip and palate transmembrane protein 1-like protein [Mizuhopecten yessoensis]